MIVPPMVCTLTVSGTASKREIPQAFADNIIKHCPVLRSFGLHRAAEHLEEWLDGTLVLEPPLDYLSAPCQQSRYFQLKPFPAKWGWLVKNECGLLWKEPHSAFLTDPLRLKRRGPFDRCKKFQAGLFEVEVPTGLFKRSCSKIS